MLQELDGVRTAHTYYSGDEICITRSVRGPSNMANYTLTFRELGQNKRQLTPATEQVTTESLILFSS